MSEPDEEMEISTRGVVFSALSRDMDPDSAESFIQKLEEDTLDKAGYNDPAILRKRINDLYYGPKETT